MTLDQINGVFELGGALFNALNIREIRTHKTLRGVHWLPYFWFSGWGVYNLFYYPSLNQWFSFSGGCAIVLVNIVWLGHVAYYYFQDSEDPLENHDTFEMKV